MSYSLCRVVTDNPISRGCNLGPVAAVASSVGQCVFTAAGVSLTATGDCVAVRGELIRLTLRLLMSYIYIYIYIYIYMEHPFLMFLDHTQRRRTVGRTPLDE